MRLSMRACAAMGIGVLALAGCGTGTDVTGESLAATVGSSGSSPVTEVSAATVQPSGAATPSASSFEAAALSSGCVAADYTENDVYASPDECAFIAMTVTITPDLAAAYTEADWVWADPFFEASGFYDFYEALTPEEVVDAANVELASRISEDEVSLDRELLDGTHTSDYYAMAELQPSVMLDGDVAMMTSGVFEWPFFVATMTEPTLDGDLLTLRITLPSEGTDRLVLRLPSDVIDTNGEVQGRSVTWNDPGETMLVSFAGVSADALAAAMP